MTGLIFADGRLTEQMRGQHSRRAPDDAQPYGDECWCQELAAGNADPLLNSSLVASKNGTIEGGFDVCRSQDARGCLWLQEHIGFRTSITSAAVISATGELPMTGNPDISHRVLPLLDMLVV